MIEQEVRSLAMRSIALCDQSQSYAEEGGRLRQEAFERNRRALVLYRRAMRLAVLALINVVLSMVFVLVRLLLQGGAS